MTALDDAGGFLQIGEVADLTLRDPSTITRQVDGLCSKAMLRKDIDDEDRRVVYISMTPRGRKELDRVEPLTQHLMHTMLEGVSAQYLSVTMEVLGRIQVNLRDHVDSRAQERSSQIL
jgi:MarR family transcriptional regulator for hemolysin